MMVTLFNGGDTLTVIVMDSLDLLADMHYMLDVALADMRILSDHLIALAVHAVHAVHAVLI